MTDTQVVVRVSSHRAADRVARVLGPLTWFYDRELQRGGTFLVLSPEDYEKVRDIPSVLKTRMTPDEVGRCW